MIKDNAPQGSLEWYQARLGIPTSSNFDKIVTTKGLPSKQREKYMYQLAAERITGTTENGYQSAAMQRGILVEAEARAMYEFITDNEVEQVGVCYPDKRKLCGCSPDGLVGKDGLVEIKCPTSPIHVGYLLYEWVSGDFPMTYYQQCQGQLLITGRKWVDFFSYYPGLKPLLIRVERDKLFLSALLVELRIFCDTLDVITEKLRSA